MKSAIMEILEKCPNLRFYMESKVPQHDLKSLNINEQQLVGLSRFFEHEESFDLIQLSKEEDSYWIEFAMDRLHTYFYTDSYLVKSPKPLIIKNLNDLLSHLDFGME